MRVGSAGMALFHRVINLIRAYELTIEEEPPMSDRELLRLRGLGVRGIRELRAAIGGQSACGCA